MSDLEDMARNGANTGNEDLEEQCDKALFYLEECGKKFWPKGIDILIKAADQGSETALNMLGECYEVGKGVKKSKEKALECYLKLAEFGFPLPFKKLGELESDPAKALEYFSKGAESGDEECMEIMALKYFHGDGIEQDYERSKALFMKLGAIREFNRMLPDEMKHLADNSEEEMLEKTITEMMESHNLQELLLQMRSKNMKGGWEPFDEMDDDGMIRYYDEDDEKDYRLVRIAIINGKLKYRKQELEENYCELIPKKESAKWIDFVVFRDCSPYTDSSFVEMLEELEVMWEYTQKHPELLVLK